RADVEDDRVADESCEAAGAIRELRPADLDVAGGDQLAPAAYDDATGAVQVVVGGQRDVAAGRFDGVVDDDVARRRDGDVACERDRRRDDGVLAVAVQLDVLRADLGRGGKRDATALQDQRAARAALRSQRAGHGD